MVRTRSGLKIEDPFSSLSIQDNTPDNKDTLHTDPDGNTSRRRPFGTSSACESQLSPFTFAVPQQPTAASLRALEGISSLASPHGRPSGTGLFGYADNQGASQTIFTFRKLYNASPHSSPAPETKQALLDQTAAQATTRIATELLPAYNVHNEQPPENADFFSSQYQEQLRRGIRAAKCLVDQLDDFQLMAGTDIRRLRGEARDCSNFHATDTRIIALLGDSGEGKSSVINSLLHCNGVAETSDAGMACTSVITEFRHRKPDQAAPFTVEVDYLSEANIEETIKELLWSYGQLYLPGVEGNLNGEEYRKCQEESAVAWSTLQAAFDDKEEFREALLRDTSTDGQVKALRLLQQWTRQLDWPRGGMDGSWTTTAQTAEQCRGITRKLMHNRTWPFTKVIRVFLSAQVLKTGIVLADLPGLRDTNLARVRATERYLFKADHIFVIAKISRALSDQSLNSSLYAALAQHIPQEWDDSAGQSLSVSVVCTKTEDINFTALKSQFCGPGKAVSEAELQALDNKIMEAKNKDDAKAKKQYKGERDLLFVKARNEFVKAGLKRAYAAKVEHKKLNVFCVSNKDYDKHCRKGRTQLVAASGIPELRQFCHSINAQAQLDESRNFLIAKLPTLLGSVRLWMERVLDIVDDEAEDKAVQHKLLDGIASAYSKTEQRVRERVEEFKSDLQQQIMRYIDHRNGHWESAALMKSDEWKLWHWSNIVDRERTFRYANAVSIAQYDAWCRHNGHHFTQKVGDVNWNQAINWKMRAELAFQWDLVDEQIPELFDDVKVIVMEGLDEVEISFISHKTADPLLMSLESRHHDFDYRAQQAQRKMLQDFRIIRRNASEDNYNSYVLRGMLPAYRSASLIFGTGKQKAQISTIQGRISNGNLFPSIAMLVDKDLEEFALQAEKNISALVEEALKPIEQDVLVAYGTHDSPQHSNGLTEVLGGHKEAVKLANRLQQVLPDYEKQLLDVKNALAQLL